MSPIRKSLPIGLTLSAALVATALSLAPARAMPEEKLTLLTILSEWKYPGSTLVDGATMSDGGNPEIVDMKCESILATPDPFEDVVGFYAKKVGEAPTKPADARAVVTQDDSKGRPVAVRVIAVHQVDISTTLVITRAEGEKVTHIAWSQYRKFRVGR